MGLSIPGLVEVEVEIADAKGNITPEHEALAREVEAKMKALFSRSTQGNQYIKGIQASPEFKRRLKTITAKGLRVCAAVLDGKSPLYSTIK